MSGPLLVAYELDPVGELTRCSAEAIRSLHFTILRAWAIRLGAEPAPSSKRDALAVLERARVAAFRRAGLELRDSLVSGLPPELRSCAWCGDSFVESRRGRRRLYCSPECRLRAYRARQRAGRGGAVSPGACYGATRADRVGP